MELKWPIRYEATQSKPLNSIIVYEKSMQQLNVNERLPDMTPLLNVLSEWLLFNTKLAIYQLYHDGNKLHFDEMMMMMMSTLN